MASVGTLLDPIGKNGTAHPYPVINVAINYVITEDPEYFLEKSFIQCGLKITKGLLG